MFFKPVLLLFFCLAFKTIGCSSGSVPSILNDDQQSKNPKVGALIPKKFDSKPKNLPQLLDILSISYSHHHSLKWLHFIQNSPLSN